MALAPITSIPTQLITDGTIMSGDLNASDAANFRTVLNVDQAGSVVASPAFKNLIIGGDFTTNPWQRGTSFAGLTGSKVYTADRWFYYCPGGIGSVTVSKVADAPTFAQAGVLAESSLKINVNSTGSPSGAGEAAYVSQNIEGLNAYAITGGAITVSFWVKCSTPGTYAVCLRNQLAARSVPGSFSVSSAGTWEKKTITFPVDTGAAWYSNNLSALEVRFTLVADKTYSSGLYVGTDLTWAASNFKYCTSAHTTTLYAVANNYMQLALVQLEAGSSATTFEALPEDVVLARCFRYYYRINGAQKIGTGNCYDTTSAYIPLAFPVPMRTAPTDTTSSNSGFNVQHAGTQTTSTSLSGNTIGANYTELAFTCSGALTAGRPALLGVNTSQWIAFNAEL